MVFNIALVELLLIMLAVAGVIYKTLRIPLAHRVQGV